MSEQLDGWISAAITVQGTGSQHTFSLDDGALLAQFAAEEALSIGVPMVFSLADASGHQRYFFSMENALLISHQLAPEKARTAVALNKNRSIMWFIWRTSNWMRASASMMVSRSSGLWA